MPLRIAALLLTTVLACASPPDYLRDADPVNADLTIHVVIENPVGTNEKWEVRSDGRLVRESYEGSPVAIPYLPWPANGGMIPRTLLSAELGGDGEPVDVLVLGPALPRGSLVSARVIGLLRMLDRLERDDKVLAVVPGTPLGSVQDVAELEESYPGVIAILETWYRNSRRPNAFTLQGLGSRGSANRLISESAMTFDALERDHALPTWNE